MHVFSPSTSFLGISNTCNVAASNMRVVVGFYLVCCCCCCCSRFYNETNTRILNGCARTVRRGAWLATWPFSWLIYAFKVQQHKKKNALPGFTRNFQSVCAVVRASPFPLHTHMHTLPSPTGNRHLSGLYFARF